MPVRIRSCPPLRPGHPELYLPILFCSLTAGKDRHYGSVPQRQRAGLIIHDTSVRIRAEPPAPTVSRRAFILSFFGSPEQTGSPGAMVRLRPRHLCRCSSMAEHLPSKQATRVRFPSPAPGCAASPIGMTSPQAIARKIGSLCPLSFSRTGAPRATRLGNMEQQLSWSSARNSG